MQYGLLFGPPGAGKFTMIEMAKRRGMLAEDLELFGHGARGCGMRLVKAQELAQQEGEGVMLVGMADIHPEVFPDFAVTILLLPSKDVYIKCLQDRDAQQEDKRGQHGIEIIYPGFAQTQEDYDHVIINDSTPEETFEEIFGLINKTATRTV